MFNSPCFLKPSYTEEEAELLIPIVQSNLKKERACKPPFDEEAFLYYKCPGVRTICNLHEFRTILKDCDPNKYQEDKEVYEILYELPLGDMPLFLNHLYLKAYAIWRLYIGK